MRELCAQESLTEVEVFGQMIGRCRASAYRIAAQVPGLLITLHPWPSERYPRGRGWKVKTAEILRYLGLDEPTDATTARGPVLPLGSSGRAGGLGDAERTHDGVATERELLRAKVGGVRRANDVKEAVALLRQDGRVRTETTVHVGGAESVRVTLVECEACDDTT